MVFSKSRYLVNTRQKINTASYFVKHLRIYNLRVGIIYFIFVVNDLY